MTKLLYTLNKERDFPKVVEAFDQGRLGYQVGVAACLYRGPNNVPCAVGAALPDEVAVALGERNRNSTYFPLLVEDGSLGADDKEFWTKLQNLHDTIVNGGGEKDIKAFEAFIAEYR